MKTYITYFKQYFSKSRLYSEYQNPSRTAMYCSEFEYLNMQVPPEVYEGSEPIQNTVFFLLPVSFFQSRGIFISEIATTTFGHTRHEPLFLDFAKGNWEMSTGTFSKIAAANCEFHGQFCKINCHRQIAVSRTIFSKMLNFNLTSRAQRKSPSIMGLKIGNDIHEGGENRSKILPYCIK